MEANDIEAKETVPASRKLGEEDARAIATAARKVIVAKGKKVTVFQVAKADEDEMVAAMLGPTGNLRAPTIRKGKTVLVGFNEDEYASALV